MTNAETTFHIVVPSPFGSIAVVWSEGPEGASVRRVLLSSPEGTADDRLATEYAYARPGKGEVIEEVAASIRAFLEGEDVSFELALVALSDCSAFQQKVLVAEHAIPRGRVSTYGRIAAHIGHRGAARAVGSALSGNPFPIIVPCHRAIHADGSLGGFQGGTAMKRALLEREGIPFTDAGRVPARLFFY